MKLGRPSKYNKKLIVVTLQVPEGDKEKILQSAKKLRITAMKGKVGSAGLSPNKKSRWVIIDNGYNS
jgi:hypothetical protein